MSTVGYATLPIIPSLRGMEAEVQKQLGPLEGMSQQIGRRSGRGFISDFTSNAIAGLDQLGGSIIDSVTKWSKRAAIAGGAVLGVGLWGGLQRVLDTEDATKTFQQVGLSLGETNDVMEQLRDRFETGPFAYPDVYDVSSQLAASGASMEQLVHWTGAVGDLAAFAQEDLSRVGEITSVIGAQGRITANEMNRLAQMGVPIRQILAEGLDISVSELNDMVSAGELSSEMFFDLISDAHQFDGAMESFADTTRGAWSIMKAGIAGAGEALLSPWFGEGGTMVQFLQRVNDYIFSTLQPTLARWGEWLYDVGVPALQSFGEAIRDRVMPVIERFTDWVKDNKDLILDIAEALGIAAIAVGGLSVAVRVLNTAIKANKIVLAITLIVTAITYAWQNSETFRNVVTGAAEAVGRAFEWLQGFIGPIFDWIGDKFSWFTSLFSSDGEGGALGRWAQEHVGPVLESLQELFGVVWERISEIFSAAWEGIQAVWDAVGEPVMMVIEAVWEQIKDAAATAWEVIRTIIETTLGVISGIIDVVTAVITGDWEGAHEALMGIVDTVWEGIKTVVETIMGFVGRTIERALNAIRGVWEFVWDAVSGWLSDTWESIKTAVSNGVSAVVEWIAGLPGRAWDALSGFARDMWNRGTEAFAEMRSGVIYMAGRLVDWVRELPGRILRALGNLGRILYDAGRKILTGLWDGMKSVWSNMTGWIGNLGGWIANLKGPIEYDRVLLVPQGEAIIGGLRRGMEAEWKNVERLLGTMTAEIPDAVLGLSGVGGPSLPSTHIDVAGGSSSASESPSTSTGVTFTGPIHLHGDVDVDVLGRRLSFAAKAGGL